jgi:SWI/SNF-related matrix-associated actin-dependent regulator 1 of chromatin subfamily A
MTETTSPVTLDELRARVAEAVVARDEAAAAVEAAKSDAEEIMASMAARLGLGEIVTGEYDEAKTQADDRVSAAVAALERAEAALEAVQARAAALAQAEAAERVEVAEAEVAKIEAHLDKLRGQERVAEQRLADAEQRLRAERDAANVVEAEFSETAAKQLDERRRSDLQLVRWHVVHGTVMSDPQIPLRLRAQVEEGRRQSAERRRRDRENLLAQSKANLRAQGFTETPRDVRELDAQIMNDALRGG